MVEGPPRRGSVWVGDVSYLSCHVEVFFGPWRGSHLVAKTLIFRVFKGKREAKVAHPQPPSLSNPRNPNSNVSWSFWSHLQAFLVVLKEVEEDFEQEANKQHFPISKSILLDHF